jgi:hypothetical protein
MFLRPYRRTSKITFVDASTSPAPRKPGIWPAVGGGLLALGLTLSVLPNLFRDATGLTSPLYEPAQIAGVVALGLALAIFAIIGVRVIVNANRRAPLR